MHPTLPYKYPFVTSNDQNIRIRGFKQFWHQSGFSWYKEEDDDFNKKLDKSITPVSPNNHFRFKVWFENLSDIELGALLFCLDLPTGLGYKLGMGKPIGLGTITIAPTLFITNRFKRYAELFDLNQRIGVYTKKKLERMS